MIDYETAFLHGDLEEEIFMDCPKGMNKGRNKCLKLKKTIYGLVQSARQWFKKLIGSLRKIGFKQCEIDPCLVIYNKNGRFVLMALYVDDCLCIGSKRDIDWAIENIKKDFVITIDREMTDYLSCNIISNYDGSRCWLGQPHLIKNLERKFGERVKKLQKFKTPGTPGKGVMRPENPKIPHVSKEEHADYRSGVGMLLYLVKHSRPDIANVVRELSKALDCPTKETVKEMLRVIKFVLDTREFGLKIEPKMLDKKEMQWSMTAYSDSEFSGDRQTRHSVYGHILFLMGVPILWKSKAMKSVTLSSTESEYFACSEAAREVKFVIQLLQSIGIKVELPVIVKVDNVGAIFMTQNATTSARTRHIDIRAHYIRELVEDGIVK
ncbi:MAG: Ty1/Copia family ribonuclease HI, partial [Marinobacter sp.]